MAFRDFFFPAVERDLGLILSERRLFERVAPLDLRPDFEEGLKVGIELALAANTEKARSEFIIAPTLIELYRHLGGSIGLFSGVEFDVDASRGLNGFCDFILTRSSLQSVLKAPVLTIVEAKNDSVRSGLGQCIAAMVAAREFNVKASTPGDIYGAVTTGSTWKFLKLTGDELTLDIPEYFIAEVGRIMGILAQILHSG